MRRLLPRLRLLCLHARGEQGEGGGGQVAMRDGRVPVQRAVLRLNALLHLCAQREQPLERVHGL